MLSSITKFKKYVSALAVALPLFATAEVKVNMHQLNGGWWTAPQQPEIELAVVNDSTASAHYNVQLTVATDTKQPVCSLSQNVATAAGDSAVCNFRLNLAPGFYR